MSAAETVDVAIVGGGAAGLAAGCALVDSGRRVVLLEARERLGGRIHTHHVATPAHPERSIPVEVGAEFVHGLPPASWDLIRPAKLPSFELCGRRLELRGREVQAAIDDTHCILENMNAWVRELGAGIDATFADYLDAAGVQGEQRRHAVAYVEGFNAADHRLVGVRSLERQQRAEDAIQADRLFRLTGGYDGLVADLAGKFKRAGGAVALRHRVRRVEWRRHDTRIHVSGPDGRDVQWRAPQAVVTLPLGVLQSDSVAFEPKPSAILRHARRLIMGSAQRVTYVFGAAGYADVRAALEQFSFLMVPERWLRTWWTAAPQAFGTLTGWTGGPNAAAMHQQLRAGADPGSLLADSLPALAAALQIPASRIQQAVSSWHFHDWSADPFSRGAYSYVPVAADGANAALCNPIDETLYFAGEHTDVNGDWATVHGALLSGARAAAQLRAAGV